MKTFRLLCSVPFFVAGKGILLMGGYVAGGKDGWNKVMAKVV